MFENLVNQQAGKLITSDIKKNILPGAVLFSGSDASGKLTAALELARVLSCHEEKKSFNCSCSSCLQHKSLTCSNLLLLGPRDCFLEISAAKQTFLKAVQENATYQLATRYLFIRSVRKLTLRFNPMLLKDDGVLNKIASLMDGTERKRRSSELDVESLGINGALEILDVPHELPPFEQLTEICDYLEKQCLKLEKDFLYDSIPISHIRNMETWAHVKSEFGKKTIIIENADRMQNSVRNALLKILEEPPADCVFILLTSKRNAMMQTILSRVRTYNFRDRTLEQQKEVITRVFHSENYENSINAYLLTFLPVHPDIIEKQSKVFFDSIAKRSIPNIAEIVKKCESFNPRIELKLFLNGIAKCQRKLLTTPEGTEVAVETTKLLRECWDNITMYNQNPVSALEILLRDLSSLNVRNGNLFRLCVDM